MSGIITDNVGRSSGLMKAADAGGAHTLVSTFTAPDSTTQSAVFALNNSTYTNYRFLFWEVETHTGSCHMTMELGTASDTWETATVYTCVGYFMRQGLSSQDQGESSLSCWRLIYTGNGNVIAGSSGVTGYLNLINPAVDPSIDFRFTYQNAESNLTSVMIGGGTRPANPGDFTYARINILDTGTNTVGAGTVRYFRDGAKIQMYGIA